MKKNLFVFCCFWAVLSAVQAQGYDTLAAQKHSRRIMSNAPFVFKAKQMDTKDFRVSENQVWATVRLVVSEVFKNNNLKIGDTVEIHYNTYCIYDKFGRLDCSGHLPPNPRLVGEWGEQYCFLDTINQSNIFENSKGSFKLYDKVNCTAHERRDSRDSIVLAFLYNYPTEGVFLKTLYECLKPIKLENTEIKSEIKRKNKRNKKKIGGARSKIEYLPAKTLIITNKPKMSYCTRNKAFFMPQYLFFKI
jgi:hypothetical protein